MSSTVRCAVQFERHNAVRFAAQGEVCPMGGPAVPQLKYCTNFCTPSHLAIYSDNMTTLCACSSYSVPTSTLHICHPAIYRNNMTTWTGLWWSWITHENSRKHGKLEEPPQILDCKSLSPLPHIEAA